MKIEYSKGKITIVLDASEAAIKNAPLAKSGKNKLVATTGSFSRIEGAPAEQNLRLQLNLIANP